MSHVVPELANKPLVLLVEDEAAIAHTLSYAFATEGFEVHHAPMLASARCALREVKPSLIVLDVGLPDGSGFDLCRELRAGIHGDAKIPILMLTARSEELDRIVGLELGADDYVAKPFSPREVTLRVRTILRRTHTTERPRETLFHLDHDAQRITFSGQALALAKREYVLLKTLLERPGRICSRESLLVIGWGAEVESGDRTVDTHIKTLRAKLKAIRSDLDPIETHRGMGYSIDKNYA